MTDLIPIESVNSLELFVEGGLDELLLAVREEATAFEPDASTNKGRTEIASRAYKVARSKTVIDEAGKDLVSGWKDKAKIVDQSRKKAREYLDTLKAEIREPLTAWEQQEAAREAHEAALEEAYTLDEIWEQEKIMRERETVLKAEREALEAEKASLRLEAEAEERAKKAAKDKIEAAQAQALEAEKDKIAAETREKIAKEQEEERKETAVRLERERVEAEAKHLAKMQAQKDKARRDNLEHQRDVNKAAYVALKKVLDSLDQSAALDLAREIVIQIAKEQIPGIRMVY